MRVICQSSTNRRWPAVVSVDLLYLSAAQHVCIFLYFRFNATMRREDEDEPVVRLEKRIKGIRKIGHTPTHLAERGNIPNPFRIACTTQSSPYANCAVSMSTVAVLTEGAVVQQPSWLPHHLFKSPKQKPGERTT